MSKFRAFSGMALMAALAAFIGSGAPAKAVTYNPVAMIGIMNPAKKAPGVWQQASTYSVPSGTTSLFYHYPCPSRLPVVVNGGFNSNSAGQSSTFTLGYNGPRMDESPPNFGEWGWHFNWPGGAPSGIVLTFTVYCAK